MRRALLAATACCALAGFSGSALAKSPAVHILNVQLPGGGVAQIRYTGDVPPAVIFAPGPAPAGAFMPMPSPFASPFGPNSPFAVMARISAQMDQQMDQAAASLLRQVETLATAPMPVPGSVPPGAAGYSFVSTMTSTGSGACMESTQITDSGNGAPRVVSSRSGDCGPAVIHTSPAPAPAQAQPPGTILASNMVSPAANRMH
jgi:hypothetical protein